MSPLEDPRNASIDIGTMQVVDRSAHPALRATSLISRTANLYQARRGDRMLIVERESGSWRILEGEPLRHFLALSRPMTVRTFLNLPGALSVREREALLWDLYGHQMVQIGGKSWYDTQKLWQKVQQYPTFLCLHMTEQCNLACRYCQAEATPGRARMSLDVAFTIVERLAHENPAEAFIIDFHGGEPFLEFDGMMQVVARTKEVAAECGKRPTFMVQTNGMLLTPERARVLRDAGVYVGVSLDGPPEIHDRYRVALNGRGSFAQAWENVQRASEVGLQTGFLAVVHDPSTYVHISQWFREQGHLSYRLNYSSSIGRAASDLEFPAGREETFARYWLDTVRDALEWTRVHHKPLNIADINNQINNLTTRNRPFMCYRSPCGIGNTVLGFGTDGGIYACEEMASLGFLRVGDIHDRSVSIKDLVDHNEILAKLQQRTVDNIPKCRTCPMKRICSGGCTSKVFARYGTVWRESPMCGYFRIVYEELMWMLHDNPDMVENLGFPRPGPPTCEERPA